MARTYNGGADESKNFQKSVAGESDLRGKSLATYHSSQGVKKYRYLYNADTVSKAANLPCCYILSNTSYVGEIVDQPTTGSLSYFAGVFAETCTSGTWVWVQTWGYNSAVPALRYGSQESSNGLAGDFLTVFNGLDYMGTADGNNTAADSGPAYATMYAAHAIRLASVASHGTSTTTSAQPVFIRGLIP